jgi:CheY-like chemotaxis protein
MFAVQDTGKGLTDDEKKLLFMRFSQASPKTHVMYGGSGLGLFISRELVELQGGEIGVSSQAGKGSTFAFYVRARKSDGLQAAEDMARFETSQPTDNSVHQSIHASSSIASCSNPSSRLSSIGRVAGARSSALGPSSGSASTGQPLPFTISALPASIAPNSRPVEKVRDHIRSKSSDSTLMDTAAAHALKPSATAASHTLDPAPTSVPDLAGPSATEVVQSARIPAASKSLSRLSVLIVEDNLVNQKVLSKQLRNLGCAITVANHGEEALAQLRKTKYWRPGTTFIAATTAMSAGDELSAILMDLEMPVMDGLTCTRKIRELEAAGRLAGHAPIIAVSANARSAHVESAIEAGMVSLESTNSAYESSFPALAAKSIRPCLFLSY